jgi:hypothetical protein
MLSLVRLQSKNFDLTEPAAILSPFWVPWLAEERKRKEKGKQNRKTIQLQCQATGMVTGII